MLRSAWTALLSRSAKPRATGRESRARRSPAGRENARCRCGSFIEQLEVRRVLSAFTVINTGDSGTGSLRQALVDANANPDSDIIQFASGVTGTITLTSGELAITEAVNLQGPGSGVITVSGNNASRVFYVSANATISGLRITGGNSSNGGGIYNAGTLAVNNTILSGNTASGEGGGLFNWGTLTLVNSSVSDNRAGGEDGTNGAGGGILNFNSLIVDASTFSGNRSSYQGGGIYNRGASSLIVNNSTFSGNSTVYYGGGILSDGTLMVDNSTFSGNSAAFGGAINNWPNSTAIVHNSTLHANSAGNEAGGIYNRGAMILDSSTLSGNLGGYSGGITNAWDGALTVQDSTLSGNSASQGGGISNRDNGTLTLVSSTLSGNYGGGIYITSTGASTLNNSIVAANFDVYGRPNDDINGAVAGSSSHNLIGVNTGLSGISHGSNGNQIGTATAPINPLLGALQDNGGPTATMAILPGSPATNAGDNSRIPAGTITDQRGTGYARIDSSTVDIGAFELVVDNTPSTFIVTTLADSGTGSLRQAVLEANANNGSDIIRFAAGLGGTITLTSGELDIPTDSLDIQGPGAGIITVSGNHVSRVFNVTANAAISSLTISNGSSAKGGGIYNAYGTLTVRNSTLSDNSADIGGGIYNAYGALTVDNSIFSGNSASGGFGYGGGGIYNANYGTRTVVRNSTFSDNAAFYGGGIANEGTLIMDSSTFSGNTAAGEGGGLFNRGTLAVVNSTLNSNSGGGAAGGSNGGGGGISNRGTLTLDSSILSGNWGSYEAGGIYNAGLLTVRDSTLSGNLGWYYGGGIVNAGTLSVDNSTFSGNSAGATGGGISNREGANAAIHNSTLNGNQAGEGGGIFNRGMMSVDSCTLNGNVGGYGGGISNSWEGTLTVLNSTLSGNWGGSGGGAISNRDNGTMTVDNSTISGNSSGYDNGGGIYIHSFGTTTLNNTIVAANFADIPVDIFGTLASGSSYNLIGVHTNLSGISHGSNGNQIGTAAMPINPMLGALQNNGGPTKTMAILPGSPATNAGDNSRIPAGTITDQRGTGYARIENGTVDIGAYENSPPVMTDPGTQAVDEGSSLNFTLDAVDDPGDVLIYSIQSGSQIGMSLNPATGAFSWTPGETQDGVYGVTFRVTDSGGLYDQQTITITVNEVNTAPSLSVGPVEVTNTDLTFTSLASDPDVVAAVPNRLTFSLTGAPLGATIDASTGVFHWTPAIGQQGVYTFTVGVNDNTGTANALTTQSVTITTLGVVNGDLVLIGTSGNDVIRFSRVGNSGAIEVLLNDVSLGAFGSAQGLSATGRIIAHGLSGNDEIQVSRGITRVALLFGEDGNDRLGGGSSSSILIGGNGDDTLLGGNGRDLLLGGNGADRIIGKADDDILIAGTTLYDRNAGALSTILAQWNRTDLNFGKRVAAIRDGAHGYGGPRLNATTVSDDNDIDTLTGSGGNDWFLLNSSGGTALDKVTDLSDQEEAWLLDLTFVNFGGV